MEYRGNDYGRIYYWIDSRFCNCVHCLYKDVEPMIPRNRKQLLDWVEDNLPSPVLKKAFRYGRVELLGAFKPVPGSSNPGWIIRATSSMTGKEWYIVVAFHTDTGKLKSYMTEENLIDINNYCGGKTLLYKGDYGGKLRDTI